MLTALLDAEEDDLWPEVRGGRHARNFGPEVCAVYPHRWAVPRDVWHKLFAGAEHEIDILVYSGLFLFEDTGMLKLLTAKADADVRIRLLLGDPGVRAILLVSVRSAAALCSTGSGRRQC